MAGSAGQLTVLVVDDRPLYREMLGRVVRADRRLALAGEVADGREALKLARGSRPDAIVTAAFVPKLAAEELLRRLHGEADPPKVLVLADGPTAELYDVVGQDPDSLLYKTAEAEEICDEIVAMSEGDERSRGRVLLERAKSYALARPKLDKHEVKLLELKAAGMRDGQIADELHCAKRIVEEGLHAIRVRLEAGTTTAAVARAYEFGLLAKRRTE
jgi:DNA-binding NarL/FixJ family response regulator